MQSMQRRQMLLNWKRTIPRKWFSLASAVLIVYIVFTYTLTGKQSVKDRANRDTAELARANHVLNNVSEIVQQAKPPEKIVIAAPPDTKGDVGQNLELQGDAINHANPVQDIHQQNLEPQGNSINHANPVQDINQQNLEPPGDSNPIDKPVQDIHQQNIQPPGDSNQQIQQPPVQIPPLVFGPDGLGQNGAAVTINKTSLPKEEQELFDKLFKKNDFNEYLSDRISVDRTVPEARDPLCLNVTYPTDLPDTSVIVTFLNEAWSVLVRSVHSIINTSPPHLLREIILVDDFSEYDYLKAPLDVYMKKFPKVRIIRNEKREGLIRTRLIGAAAATGKVLTFLDSHIECATNWLPPLLARIKEDPSHVVWPVIPNIDRYTFQFTVLRDASQIQVGVFNWNMVYTWEVPKVSERETPISPIRSPTMAGGLFSIDRDYFYHIGSYDEQMLFWGAENLEISFRIWTCGGTLEVIPCSIIGHVFRSRNVNAIEGSSSKIRFNNVRTAMVWMDEYKYMYSKATNTELKDYGDITSRLELRKSLNCKSFAWYLDNVYKSAFKPEKSLISGLLEHGDNRLLFTITLDTTKLHSASNNSICLQAYDSTNNPLQVGLCNSNDFRRQVFYKTQDEELRLMGTCLDTGKIDQVIMYPCHKQKGTQHILVREDYSIFSPNAGKCIELAEGMKQVVLRPCNGSPKQKWVWEKKVLQLLTQP